MKPDDLLRELEQILAEAPAALEARVGSALSALLDATGGRVVLFGAGGLGSQALACLRTIGVEPLAFTDNNPALWNTEVLGVRVLSPAAAATKFGASALFIVTVWNPKHWFTQTFSQLTLLGCRLISSASPLYWRFSETLLPFYAQDQPSNVVGHASDVIAAAGLWSDAQSRIEYLKQIRWRVRGEWEFDRPSAAGEVSYFLPDVFRVNPSESFLDCGAFDGDTLKLFLAWSGGHFREFVALEPDPSTFQALSDYVRSLERPLRQRIRCIEAAVGATTGVCSFDAGGGVGLKRAPSGGVSVRLVTIDDLLGQSPSLTFLKMDIEGAEYDALLGAGRVIQRDGPLLSVCVYHSQEDLWRLPLLMNRLLPDHAMFLRNHEGDGWQTVAYCVPKDRVVARQ